MLVDIYIGFFAGIILSQIIRMILLKRGYTKLKKVKKVRYNLRDYPSFLDGKVILINEQKGQKLLFPGNKEQREFGLKTYADWSKMMEEVQPNPNVSVSEFNQIFNDFLKYYKKEELIWKKREKDTSKKS